MDVKIMDNTRKIPLTVIKKSTDGSLLSGAEFTLYKDDGNGVRFGTLYGFLGRQLSLVIGFTVGVDGIIGRFVGILILRSVLGASACSWINANVCNTPSCR